VRDDRREEKGKKKKRKEGKIKGKRARENKFKGKILILIYINGFFLALNFCFVEY
jgi:hypothetical protein